MQMADHYSPQWALKETTYFDHETHRFRVGDLEIEGGRIHAVKPPGTSTFEQAVPAREWVCTPGLVNVLAGAPLIDGAPERLLSAGMTTAGTLYATARECIVAATRTRLRLVTRLILNPFARARSQQRQPDAEARAPEIHALERLNALVRCNGGRFSIAMHCPSIVSAYELVYAQNLATALRLNLSFVLSDNARSARAFRERFYSSETHLLSYLQLLRPGTTVLGLSQLTRADIDMLAHSGADVPGLKAISTPQRRTRGHRRAPAGTASAGSRSGLFCGGCASCRDVDACVDAVTVSAAAALGEPACGRIAPGMRADLCLFAPPGTDPLGGGSETFVQLFESRRPDAVIVGGTLALGEWNTPIHDKAGLDVGRTHRREPAPPLSHCR